jgi:hypothetical protein
MKEQYFGDVSDYRKYGLLRCLGESGLRVGVVWMLTSGDTRPDGGRTQYLQQPEKWRKFDPDLYAFLASCVAGPGGRSVRRFESSGLLPGGRYFSAVLTDSATARDEYFRQALDAVTECDAAFFDADNGLEVSSVRRGARGSSRYLYWQEVAAAWARGVSLVIFQHFNRERRSAFIERLCARLRNQAPDAWVTAVRTSHVLFLSAWQARHRKAGLAAVQRAVRRWPQQMVLTSDAPYQS